MRSHIVDDFRACSSMKVFGLQPHTGEITGFDIIGDIAI